MPVNQSIVDINNGTLSINVRWDGPTNAQPVVFIHGMWMSGRFFEDYQVPRFGDDGYYSIAPDLRGHGDSDKPESGYTVKQYALDLADLFIQLSVQRPVLVGWSMGAMVIFEYLKQWVASDGTVDVAGMTQNVAGIVLVDQAPSDFKWPGYGPGYEHGVFGLPDLASAVDVVLTPPDGMQLVVNDFVPLMLHNDDPSTISWMVQEVMKVPPHIATCIMVNQTLQDYRSFLPKIAVPTLLIFADDPELTNPNAGKHVQVEIPGSQLEVFPNSAHCLFIEQAGDFNDVVRQFIKNLP